MARAEAPAGRKPALLRGGPRRPPGRPALDSPEPFQAFLVFAVFYAYYHVVRQHYGFLALYATVAGGAGGPELRLERWALYAGCWAPDAYFLLTHPRARTLLRLGAEVVPGSAESLLAAALLAAWVLSLAVPVIRLSRERDRGPRPSSLYVLVTVALYGVIYVAVARAEPVYTGSTGPDQDFLLISVLVTLFHNVQYLGLVWFHNRNRYAGPGDFGPPAPCPPTRACSWGAAWPSP